MSAADRCEFRRALGYLREELEAQARSYDMELFNRAKEWVKRVKAVLKLPAARNARVDALLASFDRIVASVDQSYTETPNESAPATPGFVTPLRPGSGVKSPLTGGAAGGAP